MQKPEKKARSPTLGSSGKSALDVVFFALECSQRIGQWLTLLFIVHTLSTEVAVIISPELHTPLQAILDSCQMTYRLGICAYFGKAAMENVLKIWNSVKSIGASTTSSNDGNG
jgi:hypothetical protein